MSINKQDGFRNQSGLYFLKIIYYIMEKFFIVVYRAFHARGKNRKALTIPIVNAFTIITERERVVGLFLLEYLFFSFMFYMVLYE